MKVILKQAAFLMLIILLEACGDENLKTVTSQTNDNYKIVVLSKEGSITEGSGKFYIEFHNAGTDQLVDVGEVQIQASMPMPGMPMVNDAKVEATDTPGRYSVKYDLSMSGAWTLKVKYDGNKSTTIPIRVN